MKKFKSGILAVLFFLSILSCSSSDDNGGTSTELPNVSTTQVTGIANTTVVTGGVVSNEGSSAVISRGVCWSVNQNPTIEDSKTSDGVGEGDFSSNITGLSPNTTYYIRAYATNSEGTSYGNELSFTTTNVPASGTFVEYIYDIVTDREGNTSVLNGTTTCLFVDGVFFDMDPYAVNYSVLFYDMVRASPSGTWGTVTYPDDIQYNFAADFGSEIYNGPYGNQVLTDWYNVNNGIPVTRFTDEQMLFVSVSWCTTGGCEVDDCYLITGKAKVTVYY